MVDVQFFDYKYLSAKEICLLGNDLELLCVAWCCKEALYKLIGLKGLSLKENFNIHTLPINDVLLINIVNNNALIKTFSIKFVKINNYILAYSSKLVKMN